MTWTATITDIREKSTSFDVIVTYESLDKVFVESYTFSSAPVDGWLEQTANEKIKSVQSLIESVSGNTSRLKVGDQVKVTI